MFKKIGISMLLGMSFTLMTACGQADNEGAEDNGTAEEAEEEKGTITFGVTPWTSTVPPTEIAALILEDMGYEIEQTQADVGGVYTGLSRGDLDVFMDGWFPNHNNYLQEFGDQIEETAVSYSDAQLGMTIPEYVEEIDSIEDIKGNEDMFENEMYGIEEGASATKTFDTMLEETGLDMKQVNSSEGGMLAEVSRKIRNEEPVAFYGWRPHPVFNQYNLKVLEGQDEFFPSAEVRVITKEGLEDEAPEAYNFLSNWSIPIDDVEQMIIEIDENDRDAREVAQEWIDENQDKVEEMKGE